ncbi:hypothetical protein [Helicobacter winghamensis]|uniref:Uncharacterized protein n=1 Tax=Helicobacter winghamensis TaxID=157268 RepID=A0A2N3PK60_9HELI|nr:hypothetical protein [Helicobacter winghamensis]PKT77584.1 hypothetical protein BCM32_05165 [Helicobacter winghamensis]PKT81823.1 hypothetical protein BCM31_01160 [Helicobacter winghamensis]PKT82001.1 hypothetical protein BCM33_00425 [Helicobacter winghamensis]QOQ98602.1 hypothetical protein A0Z60_03250 [Helicobacter winghamensis]
MNLIFASFLRFLKLDNLNKDSSFKRETETSVSKERIIKQYNHNLPPIPYKIETKTITINNGNSIMKKEITTEQIPTSETEGTQLTSEKVIKEEYFNLKR